MTATHPWTFERSGHVSTWTSGPVSGMTEHPHVRIEYKSKIYGTEVVIADRFFPSSKTCSSCGVVKESLTLSERTWVCMSCGVEHDRDLNAAMNLRTLGSRGTPGTCLETLVDKKTAAKGKYFEASRLVEARSTTRSQVNTCGHKV